MQKRKNCIEKTERGQSLMELAVSLTFILLLLSGIVDLGRAFFTYMGLRDAAQEGALYGSINPKDIAGIETRIFNSSNMLRNLNNDPSVIILVKVDIDMSELSEDKYCAGNGLKVSIDYQNFPLTMPFIGSIIGKQVIKLNATITDTILSPVCEISG